MAAPAVVHSIVWSHLPEATVAECACGGWRRSATLETVALTGLSRDESLRLAWLEHEREGLAPAPDASTAIPIASPDGGAAGR